MYPRPCPCQFHILFWMFASKTLKKTLDYGHVNSKFSIGCFVFQTLKLIFFLLMQNFQTFH
jgi:hypothetical protein